jgi:hypothetical protein
MPAKVFDAFTRLDASDVNAYLANRSFGNAIYNGAFDIWQRNTTFANSITNIYSADRWGTFRAGFATGVTTSRRASTLAGFEFVSRVQRDSGNTSTATVFMSQALESRDSRPYAGEQVTLSFYARKGTNYSPVNSNLDFSVSSGTGVDQTLWAGFTGTVQSSKTEQVDTLWKRFTVTLAVPANSTQLGVSINFNPTGTAGADDWIEVTGVQLELGSVANPFRRNGNSIGAELSACQRYYEKSYNLDVAPGTNTNIGSQMLPPYNPSNDLSAYTVNFQVEKRAAPTMSLYAPDGTINRVHIVDAGVNTSTNTTARDVGTRGFRGWLAGGTSGAPSDKRTLFHYTASAEL